MAHFAELDQNNIVINIIVVNNNDLLDENQNESEQIGITFLRNIFGHDKKYVQTSYNNNFRVKYAYIGDTYSLEHDAFISPPPFPSFIFNTETKMYEPPIPHPNDDNTYVWDEELFNWVIDSLV